MAMDDDKTLIVATAQIYTAPVDTKSPTVANYKTNKTTALTGWTNIGHTSAENPFKITKGGGDVSTKGSLQKKKLRTSISDVSYSLEISLEQFDAPSIKRYLGANAVTVDGITYAKSKPTAEHCALLIVIEDEGNICLIHAGKCDIVANGDLDVNNVEDLVSLPVKFEILEDKNGNTIGIGEVASLA
jgi:major tail protein gp23